MSKFSKNPPDFDDYPSREKAAADFGGQKRPLPRPAHPAALALAEAAVGLMEANKTFQQARMVAESGEALYNGPDFYRSEEDAYYRAAEVYADAVCAAVAVVV